MDTQKHRKPKQEQLVKISFLLPVRLAKKLDKARAKDEAKRGPYCRKVMAHFLEHI